MRRIGRQVPRLGRIRLQVVEFFRGPPVVAVQRGRRARIRPGELLPLREEGPLAEAVAPALLQVDVRREGPVGVEVAEVLPASVPHAPRGVDVHPVVVRMRGEDLFPMPVAAAEHGQEGPAVDLRRSLAAAGFQQRREEVHPADHGGRPPAGGDDARPADDQRRGDARLVEVPFAEGPLGAVVAGEDRQGGGRQDLADRAQHVAEFGVAARHGVGVARPPDAGLRRIEAARRQPEFGRTVRAVGGRPRHMRPVAPDQQAERFRVARPGAEEADRRRHAFGIMEAVVREHVEAVVRGMPIVRDLAEGGHLVT